MKVDTSRQDALLLEKLHQAQELLAEIRHVAAGVPAVEAMMRLGETCCKQASWMMGEGERFPFELE
ncbi:MAG: hypothetical protein D9V47_11875 [Clostridia bacterium]|nr:MAG: hypothetical protein D9V47_11875 [Clostridia bacterium]